MPVIEPPYIFKYCEIDNWSEWKESSCKSSCLTKSKGVIIKRRLCEHETYRTANCEGPYYDVVLCNDTRFCTKKRKTIAQYTAIKCTRFSVIEKVMNLTIGLERKPGWQASHDVKEPWIACTIYCRQKRNLSDIYTLRNDMLKLGIDSSFPDGTWCHNENDQDYYCRKHYCQPENYSFENNYEEFLDIYRKI